MQREWKAERISAGGKENGGRITDYGDAEAEVRAAAHQTTTCALTHLAVIRASGADAATFLQSQLSNDLLTLTGASQLSAYCTAQGRMIALFRIVPWRGEFLLLLPDELQEMVLKRLRMYVLRAKVTLTLAEDWAVLGVSGEQAPEALSRAGLPAPTEPQAALSGESIVLAIPGHTTRYLVLGPWETIKSHAAALGDAPMIGADAWSWLDIMAGLPTIGTATTEAFVPQMANLDLLNGINFRKGCYPGQEIVARTHYLGRLKQRMYRASLASDQALPAAGTSLSAPNLPGQPAGTVVEAQRGPAGEIDLLAVVQISSHDAGLVSCQDAPLTFHDLPYPLAASC